MPMKVFSSIIVPRNVTFDLNCSENWSANPSEHRFSVLSCCTHREPSMGTKWSSWIKKNTIGKKQYMC